MVSPESKIEDIRSRIAFLSDIVVKYKAVTSGIDLFLRFIEEELDASKKDLQEVEANLQILKTWFAYQDGAALTDRQPKYMLTGILRSLSNIESALYLRADSILPLIQAWLFQELDLPLRAYHQLLTQYVNQLTRHAGLEDPHIAIFAEEYFNQNCAHPEQPPSAHILSMTSSEAKMLRRWPILGHEIGHSIYDWKKDYFEKNISPKITAAFRSIPASVDKKELLEAENIWLENWLQELVADCVAVKTLGPSYVSQFIIDALEANPLRVELPRPIHPPMDLRVTFQLEVLEDLPLPGFDSSAIKSSWETYLRSIVYGANPFVENVLLDHRVVMAAKTHTASAVQSAPAVGLWPRVQMVKAGLERDRMEPEDLLTYVSALSLLPRSFPQERIVQRLIAVET